MGSLSVSLNFSLRLRLRNFSAFALRFGELLCVTSRAPSRLSCVYSTPRPGGFSIFLFVSKLFMSQGIDRADFWKVSF